MQTTAQKLPTGKLIIYALGQLGWSLASFSVGNLLIYFYLPAESEQQADFPPFILQGFVLGFLTIIGLINFGARLLDAFTDPMIAGMSDRSQSKWGKRRIFMAAAVIPFALFSVLVFMPPVSGLSSLNVAWLALMIALFYVSMTLYVVPYTALIAEFGHNSRQRLNISTAISITWAIGFAIGSQVYVLQQVFEPELGAVAAFQRVIFIFGILSAVLMALPVLLIDETKYSRHSPSAEPPLAALKATFANRNFRFFVLSDLTYWLAVTFITSGINYYVTLLLGLDTKYSSLLMLIMFLLSFVFYLPVNIFSRRLGKKRMLIIGFGVFAALFGLLFFMGKLPIPVMVQVGLVALLAGLPLAIFGILPNAIVADITEADGRLSGNYKAGIFFASRALMMKLGISLANIIFPSLLLLGKSANNDLGVRLTGLAALVFCILGLLIFLRYNEQEIEDGLAHESEV